MARIPTGWKIACLALALRLGLALTAPQICPSAWFAADTGSYLRPLEEWLRTGAFAVAGAPEVQRTPGYPAFLALDGLTPFRPLLLPVLLQCLLGAGSVLLLYRLVRAAAGERAAAAAALCLALEPLSVLYCARLWSETLFVFLLLAACAALPRSGLGAGLLAAAAVLVRPVGLLALPPLAFAAARTRGGWRVSGALAFLLAALAPPAAWTLRNQAVAGYARLSSVATAEMHSFRASAVVADRENRPPREVRAEFDLRSRAWLASLPRKEALDLMETETRRTLAAEPLRYAKLHLLGLAGILLSPGASEWFALLGREKAYEAGTMGGAALAAQIGLGILLLGLWSLALRGLLLRPEAAWALAPLLLSGLLMAAASFGPAGYSRFRLPLVPGLCALAGLALAGSRPRDAR